MGSNGFPLKTNFCQYFFSYHEQIWLKNCPCECKPVIYKRYVDDTFLLFRSKDHLRNFNVTLIANILILSLQLK